MNPRTKFAAAAAAMLAIGTTLAIPAASAVATGNDRIKHVLLISVDGMHQSDLDWYVANHPDSELARLAADGGEFTHAQTTDPSDSDPGGTGIMMPTRRPSASITMTSTATASSRRGQRIAPGPSRAAT